jgi:hypothetical protein
LRIGHPGRQYFGQQESTEVREVKLTPAMSSEFITGRFCASTPKISHNWAVLMLVNHYGVALDCRIERCFWVIK